LSHELPGPFCTDTYEVSYLPGRSKIGRCSYHRKGFFDLETGELLAGDCLGKRPYRSEVFTVYPSELVAWWRAEGRLVAQLPAMAKTCGSIPASEAPVILSPQDRSRYLIGRDLERGYQQVLLAARSGPHAKQLYWYQDGKLRHTAKPGDKVFLELEEGQHQLVVVDDLGLSDSLVYQVESPR
jgi:penicillin-binding protein 1C